VREGERSKCTGKEEKGFIICRQAGQEDLTDESGRNSRKCKEQVIDSHAAERNGQIKSNIQE